MNIGILGTGIVGQTLGVKLMDLGHEIVFGTRDVEQTLARTDSDAYGNPPFGEWKNNNPASELKVFQEAAASGEMLINATAGRASIKALEQAGEENIADKILIDVANPLDFSEGPPPSLTICNKDSLGEQIQRRFPDARVVKTLNTMNAYLMVNPGLVPGTHNVFVSGNDAEAKGEVSGWLTEWFGWNPDTILDLGDITTARGVEMLLPLWVQLYGTIEHPLFNFHITIGPEPAA